MNDYGLPGIPIEISEVGWHSGVPDAWRVAWMRGLAARLPSANMNVARLMPYVWSGDAAWGMANPDGTLAPLGAAYLAGIDDARSPPATPPRAAGTAGRQAISACRVRRRGSRARAGRVKECAGRAGKRRRGATRGAAIHTADAEMSAIVPTLRRSSQHPASAGRGARGQKGSRRD